MKTLIKRLKKIRGRAALGKNFNNSKQYVRPSTILIIFDTALEKELRFSGKP